MLFRRSWFPITVSLCNKLCMTYSSPVEITEKSSTEPNQHSSNTSCCLGPGCHLPKALCVSHSADNNSVACARQLSPKRKRNKCFSSQTSRMSLFLPQNRVETDALDPKLIYSSLGLCLIPHLPCLEPRYGQRLLQTQRCLSPSVLSGRHGPHSSRRCSGAGAASVLSKVIAQTGLGQSFLSILCPSCWAGPYTNTTDSPQCFLLPVPLCSGTKIMLGDRKGP